MESPSILQKAVTFVSEEARWLSHGRPYRDVMDIDHLYYRVCKPCEQFENDGCKICGCRIVAHERSPLNKISLGTTNCPHPDGPRWVSGLTPPEGIPQEVLDAALQNSKAVLIETGLPAYPISTANVTTGKKKDTTAGAVDPIAHTPSGPLIQE